MPHVEAQMVPSRTTIAIALAPFNRRAFWYIIRMPAMSDNATVGGVIKKRHDASIHTVGQATPGTLAKAEHGTKKTREVGIDCAAHRTILPRSPLLTN